MDVLLQDLRFALRGLRAQPVFFATAILTLALGIGPTTAIFSVVNAVVLRPLPYEEPDRLVAVLNSWTRTGRRSANVSGPDFYDWREQGRSFERIAHYAASETSVAARGAADYATVARVSPGFLDVFRVRPHRGRLLSAEEQRPGGPAAVVITDAFWRRQFGSSEQAVGATLRFDDRVHTIVGVTPPGFRFPARTDVYVAQDHDPAARSRSGHNYHAIARLRHDVSIEQASSEMSAIAQRLERQFPESNSGKSVALVPLQETIVGGTRTTLYVLLAAISLVLVVACANVANLLLARATNRRREIVVRAALGAARGRLVRQALTESGLLAASAAVLGVLLAYTGVWLFVTLAPADIPRLNEVGLDRSALAFTFAVSLAASLVFGLAPALQGSRVQLADGLRPGGKGSAVGARTGKVRQAFVVAQVALAVVLVTGAGLLGKSLVALANVNLGFDADRLVVLRTAVPVASLEDAPRATAFYRDVLEEIRAIPGVAAAGAVTGLPGAVRSNGSYWIGAVFRPEQMTVNAPQAILTVVTPEYFHALKVPLVRGRDFTDGDRLDAPFVAIVNEALVRQSFGDRDPIGERIGCGLDSLEPMTIVGVVRDVRTSGPERPAQAEIYMPYEQHPGPATELNIVARANTADPLALGNSIARLIRGRNPSVPVNVETMERTLATAAATPRFRTLLLAGFSVAALLIAVAGVYGVMAFTVSRRVAEIGVRVTLGATPGRLLAMILREGAALAALGLGIGVALALAGSRLIRGMLFEVTPLDPAVIASVTVVVTLAALLACLVPALRVLRVDPTEALRVE